MVVGGAKCGTTSLYHYLRQHPEIHVPCKESYLFTESINPLLPATTKIYSLDEYRQLFRNIPPNVKAAGEISSIYLYYYKEVIPRIQDMLGDIKIIIILRNPVERAYSNYKFFARDLRDERTFEKALEEELNASDLSSISPAKHYINMGFYYRQIKAFMEGFSQVKVVLFDDFAGDTTGSLNEIYEFLGVDQAKGCAEIPVYNKSGIPRNSFIAKHLFQPSPFKYLLRKVLIRILSEEKGALLIEKLRGLNLKRSNLNAEIHQRLAKLYRNDIRECEKLIDKDLTSWYSR